MQTLPSGWHWVVGRGVAHMRLVTDGVADECGCAGNPGAGTRLAAASDRRCKRCVEPVRDFWSCDFCGMTHDGVRPTQAMDAFQTPTLVDGAAFCDAFCANAQ